MRFTRLIVLMTAASIGLAPAFAEADDIALSLVHTRGRVDVPISAISAVDASATIAFRNTETGEVHKYPDPHVEVCFAKDIRERICQLTRQIVGEPMEILIDCVSVSKPIVREPLCTRPCFQISADDLAGANALAQRIRSGTSRVCASSN
jgi:preprotein translocase subunit SecD